MYLPLTERERAALRALAQTEDRDPRYQAARIVREALREAGALDRADDDPDGVRPREVPA
jgi:hypothetical protein